MTTAKRSLSVFHEIYLTLGFSYVQMNFDQGYTSSTRENDGHSNQENLLHTSTFTHGSDGSQITGLKLRCKDTESTNERAAHVTLSSTSFFKRRIPLYAPAPNPRPHPPINEPFNDVDEVKRKE